MDIPDLTRIIEAHVPVVPGQELDQLRNDVLPNVRELQRNQRLRWYSFLLHPAGQLAEHSPEQQGSVIHLRLEPSTDLDPEVFLAALPGVFKEPRRVTLSTITGIDVSQLRAPIRMTHSSRTAKSQQIRMHARERNA